MYGNLIGLIEWSQYSSLWREIEPCGLYYLFGGMGINSGNWDFATISDAIYMRHLIGLREWMAYGAFVYSNFNLNGINSLYDNGWLDFPSHLATIQPILVMQFG